MEGRGMNSIAQMEAALAALRKVVNETGVNAQTASTAFANLSKTLCANAVPLDREWESQQTRDEFRVELPHFDTSIPDFTETLAPKASIESFKQPAQDAVQTPSAQKTYNLNTRIKLRSDNKADWEGSNPTLMKGEVAIVFNGDNTYLKVGDGDGERSFKDLPYVSSPPFFY